MQLAVSLVPNLTTDISSLRRNLGSVKARNRAPEIDRLRPARPPGGDGRRLVDLPGCSDPGAGVCDPVHAGQSIGAATWCYRAPATPLVFAVSVTSYVWLLATGKPQVSTAADPPELAALPRRPRASSADRGWG